MHHIARGGRAAARVLLVAPPSLSGAPEILHGFFPAPAVELTNARLVCSDNDPVLPRGRGERLPGAADRPLAGAGHINPDAGYGPWTSVEEWAKTGAAPVSPTAP